MVLWCWRRREMECRPMTVPWNNGMFMWFVTQDSDTLRRFASWWYVMLVWPLCELSSFMMVFWPLSQIRRLCVQLVGALRLRCPHGVFMFLGGSCWRVLMRGRAFQLPNCRVWCCAIFWLFVVLFPYEGELMLFCYTIYLVIFHAFGAATRIPNEISCFSALMRCHEISSWHLMLCLTPPMRLLCFYLMRFCAVFAAYVSGKTDFLMRWTSLCDFILLKAVERLSCEMSFLWTPRRGFLVRFCCCVLHNCLVRLPTEISNGFCSTVFPMRFPFWCFLLSLPPVFL